MLKRLAMFLGGASLLVMVLAGTASAQTHKGPNKNRDQINVSAPCTITFGQKAKVASAGAKSPTVTFLPDCGAVTNVHPTTTTRVVETRVVREGVVLAQADAGAQVDAPNGGAKTGGGLAATSGLIAFSSLGSIGYGVTRLLKTRA